MVSMLAPPLAVCKQFGIPTDKVAIELGISSRRMQALCASGKPEHRLRVLIAETAVCLRWLRRLTDANAYLEQARPGDIKDFLRFQKRVLALL